MGRVLIVIALLVVAGCVTRDLRKAPRIGAPTKPPKAEYAVKTTGYCHCGVCCGWRRNWLGRAVIASGPNKGRPKAVGITASGTRVRHGVIAADTNIFAFGTVLYVPGYGYGRVEDIGGDIKGYHLDLYFRDHGTAQRWGAQRKVVRVWPPQ